jgi:hypothetical protein
MTLILSALTPRFAIQVSDRRITSLRTGELMDADMNKAVLFSNRIALGYTGLAQLEGQTTTDWLIAALRDLPEGMPLSEVANLVARKAESAIRASTVRKDWLFLAFSGTGWDRTNGDGRMHGVVYTIANYFDDSGGLLEEPRTTFQATVKTFDYNQSGWYPVGVPLTKSERRGLHRDIAACAHRKTGPSPIVRLFAELIRAVAGRSSAVGRDLMVAVIPRCVAESNTAVAQDQHGNTIPLTLEAMESSQVSDLPDKMTFCYLPEKPQAEITYGPGVVVPGGMSFSTFIMTRGNRAREHIRRLESGDPSARRHP